MYVTIPNAKARLRDEAELAFMAFIESGRFVKHLPPSLAPVCVPVGLALPKETVEGAKAKAVLCLAP